MNKALDLISKLVCGALSLILFLILFAYLIFASTSKIITKDNVSTLISSLNIEIIMGKDNINNLYEQTDSNNIDRDIVYGIINGKEFKAVLAKYYGNYIDTLLYDKDNDQITKSEVIDIVKISIDKVCDNLSMNLTEEEKNIILFSLDEDINKMVVMLSSANISNEFTEEQLNTLRFMFGDGLKNVLLIIAVIIVCLIALVRWSIYRFAIWIGGAALIAGVIFVVFGQSISSMLQSILATEVNLGVIELLQTSIIEVTSKMGMFALTIGVIQIIYYFIFKNRNKNTRI